jgi:hypothetical protein
MSTYIGPNIIREGLILYLDAANFESYPITGITWMDLSNNAYNGTLINSPTYNSANLGYFIFSGGSYINFYDVLNFELTDPFSISVWFKTSYSGSDTQSIAGKCKLNVPGGDYTGYQVGTNISGTGIGKFGAVFVSYPFVYPNSVMRRETTLTHNNNVWANGFITYDGSSNRSGILVYINGEIASTTDYESSSLTGTIITNANFEIASRDGAQQPFDGSVANIQVYNYALSITEIKQNYNALKSRYQI